MPYVSILHRGQLGLAVSSAETVPWYNEEDDE